VLDAALEQTVESAVEHGEQNSHLTLGPPAHRATSSGKLWNPPCETCTSCPITRYPSKPKSCPWG
jgi:hypothetical protein